MTDPAPNTCHSLGCSAPVSSPGEWCPSCAYQLELEERMKGEIAQLLVERFGVPRG